MNPDSTISAIRPSISTLVSTTIRGSPSAWASAPSRGRRTSPAPSAAAIRSNRFATVRPIMPRPRNRDTPSGSQVPSGPSICARGRPRRSPSRSPTNSPSTAATNSAVESSWTRRMSHRAGTTVRYGSTANPTSSQAIVHAARMNPAYWTPVNSPVPIDASPSPMKAPSAAPRTRIVRIKGLLVVPRAPACGASGVAGRTGSASLARAHGRRRGGRWSGPPGFADRLLDQGGADGVGQRRDHDELDPRDRRHVPAALARHQRPREPESGRLAKASVEAANRTQLAEQPDLTDGHGAGDQRAVAERRRESQRERQVEARLSDVQAAGEVRVHIVAGQSDARPASQDGDEQREAVRIDAGRRPSRRRSRRRGDERLDLDEDRSRALQHRRDDAARRRGIMIGEERAGRVGDLGQAALPHLEHADLLGRSVPVLRRPQEAQPAGAIPLDGKHDGDQVLERLRPGKRAVLRHVADEDDGDAVRLRELHQSLGGLAHLPDAARRPVQLLGRHGLDGIDDEEPGSLLPGKLHDPPDARLRDNPDRVTDRRGCEPQPGGPQPYL